MASPDVILPTSERLNEIAQEKLPALEADREIFKVFPTRTQDEDELSWEQWDRFTGLQKIRGLNGQPQRVIPVGMSRFTMKPGVYGEYMNIEEFELTKRRSIGTFGKPIDLTELTMQKQDQLIQRRLDRMELIGWTALSTNTISVASPQGGILYADTYYFRTYNAAVSWLNPTQSTPLTDFRNVQLFHRGYSVSFGPDAIAYMNLTTYNALVMNSNPTDLYGRRTAGLGTINNQKDFNTLMAGDNLPSIKVYDNSYLDDSFTPIMFIPDGKVVLIGKRPGNMAVGGYVMTRNASNPSFAPGAYMRVTDSADTGMAPVPREIRIDDGHNGGLAVEYPSMVIIMTVF